MLQKFKAVNLTALNVYNGDQTIIDQPLIIYNNNVRSPHQGRMF